MNKSACPLMFCIMFAACSLRASYQENYLGSLHSHKTLSDAYADEDSNASTEACSDYPDVGDAYTFECADLRFKRYRPAFPWNFLSTQVFISHFFSDSVFVEGSCGGTRRISIPDFVFGENIELKNIFLASKLAAEGKFTLPGQAAFGGVPDEQYIACAADAVLTFDGFIRQTAAELSLFYTCNIYNCLKLAAGFYIPIKHQERYLTLNCVAGRLGCGQSVQVIGEDSIKQFFTDFIDVKDYIFRGILEPKCISCLLTQSRTGLGDISVATILDMAGYSDYFQVARFGAIGILPMGHIRSGNILWEIELGTGAFRFKPFIDIHTFTGYRYFNPRFYLDMIYSVPFTGMRRIPQLKDTKSELLIPSRFEPFTVAPFEDCDATKREFADQASRTRIHYGTQVDLVVGNLFFNIFDSAFSAGLFYEGTYKAKDKFRVVCPKTQFNTHLLTKITNEVAHMIRWNVQLSWNQSSVFEFGSRHVLGGRNTFNIHEIFGSVILYY